MSVNLPTKLYQRVKDLVKGREDLGYRSITEFVGEAVRKRMKETDTMNNLRSILEPSSPRADKEEGNKP